MTEYEFIDSMNRIYINDKIIYCFNYIFPFDYLQMKVTNIIYFNDKMQIIFFEIDGKYSI